MKPKLKLVTPNPETKPLYAVGDPVWARNKGGKRAMGIIAHVAQDRDDDGRTIYAVVVVGLDTEGNPRPGEECAAVGMGTHTEEYLEPRNKVIN